MVGHQVSLASTLQWCKPKLPENTVTNTTSADALQLEYQQILQDRVELLQNAGEEYSEARVSTWAWGVLLDRHPELTPEEAWLG